MPRNVYHTHNAVNSFCASAAICRILPSAHNLHVKHKAPRRRTFLREWRAHRGKTLVQVAEEIGMTHGQLSRIERGDQPYNQFLLETLAEIYACEPVDLMIRNPLDSAAIWSIWDQAQAGERQQIVKLAETVIGFRHKDGTTG
jgi:transcriptional regulator with XRE-family HTH domain